MDSSITELERVFSLTHHCPGTRQQLLTDNITDEFGRFTEAKIFNSTNHSRCINTQMPQSVNASNRVVLNVSDFSMKYGVNDSKDIL